MNKSISKKYQKLSDIDHVLKRPGMYVGSMKPHTENIFLPEKNKQELKFKEREITYNPGFLKIFDEIISNSVDEHKENKNLNKIDVIVNQETGWISVKDNGGIPVQKHKEYKEWIPEMIFSNLKSGSNFNDSDNRLKAGTHGVGSTLTNIFSKEFIIETCDGQKKFKQTFFDNMKNRFKPIITKSKSGFTKISWLTDIDRFGMKCITDESILLIKKRLYDIAACNLKIKLTFNGNIITFRSFKDYVNLFTDGSIFFEKSKNWNIGITQSESGFNAISFVNSVETKDGGTHVDYITNQIINFLRKKINKKHKIDVKPSELKRHLFIFINCDIINPGFHSQTKEKLITEVKDFGTSHKLNDVTLNKIFNSDIIESVLDWVERKNQAKEKAKLRKLNKQINKKNVLKLVDAKKRGNREMCTLSIYEGDCLDKDTKVLCMDLKDGLIHKPIKKININDYVITHNNKLAKVKCKNSKILKLVNIKTKYGNMKASLNHKFIIYDTYVDSYLWLPIKDIMKNIKRYKFVYNKLHTITYSSEISNITYNEENIIIELNDQVIKSSFEHKFLVYDLLLQEFNLIKSTDLNKDLHLIIFSNMQ